MLQFTLSMTAVSGISHQNPILFLPLSPIKNSQAKPTVTIEANH